MIRKPAPLEILLEHSHHIPIFKNIDHGDICSLVNKVSLKNINKGEFISKEHTTSSDVIGIVLYGSFSVSLGGKLLEELKEGDMFGVKNILHADSLYIAQNTIQAQSYKNLLLSFRLNPRYSKPCGMSSRFYKNVAIYFSHKLRLEHKNLSNNLKKGQ